LRLSERACNRRRRKFSRVQNPGLFITDEPGVFPNGVPHSRPVSHAVSGTVRAATTGGDVTAYAYDPGRSVWLTKEKPPLDTNPKVTGINVKDPTGRYRHRRSGVVDRNDRRAKLYNENHFQQDESVADVIRPEGNCMSLTVPTDLLAAAERGQVSDAAFVDCVRTSLPYAWHVIDTVMTDLHAGGADVAEHELPPPSEAERGQLLRALASDAIRGGLERHFGAILAFQNRHRVAAFRQSAVSGEQYRRFVSPRGQLLNQSPELRNC